MWTVLGVHIWMCYHWSLSLIALGRSLGKGLFCDVIEPQPPWSSHLLPFPKSSQGYSFGGIVIGNVSMELCVILMYLT